MQISKGNLTVKKILRVLGPGFITGASDDDPSGIATYSQTGSVFGLKQLWTAVFTFPFMVVIQEMCGRIGMTTGSGISTIVKINYGRKVLYPILLILCFTNIINIGADLGAMASSAQMLFRGSFILWLVIVTALTVGMIIFIPYKIYVRYLKILCITLLGYIITLFFVKQDWHKVMVNTFIPSFSLQKDYLMNFVAILGTTISPYLFFWQANEEVEEQCVAQNTSEPVKMTKISKRLYRRMELDTVVGMFFSNAIAFFVIDATAVTLGAHGMHNIQTANDAALALKPFAGQYAALFFSIGILGTGLLAVPVLAGSAGYAVAETFKWKEGLSLKYFEAPKFYLTIAIITIVGLLIHFTHIQPFTLLYYSAILNGVAAPPIMAVVLLISNNKKIMGEHTNSWLTNVLGITITAVMAAGAIAMFVYL